MKIKQATGTAVHVESPAPIDVPPGMILDPDDSLPLAWRLRGANEPAAAAYIHGPRAAKFEEPPPPNDERPDTAEEIGDDLTPRQLAFCERYVECLVAARAAREAGYAEATAAHQATRLLRHPRIMRRIIELRRNRRLDDAYRRETLLDKFDAVFAASLVRNEFYAAIQALTMEARLSRIAEAMPGFRYVHRGRTAAEDMVWDAAERLEQKLCEIAVGDFPGAVAAVVATHPQPAPADTVPRAGPRKPSRGGLP